jgi:hypothetical protein
MQTFSVCYRKLPGDDNHDYTADVYLDGNLVSGLLYQRDQMCYLDVDTISSVELSPTETRDFMFNPIELTGELTFRLLRMSRDPVSLLCSSEGILDR